MVCVLYHIDVTFLLLNKGKPDRFNGWGLLSFFFRSVIFPIFSSSSKHTLTVKNRVYVWRVSPQLSCGDTCQIWMWFEQNDIHFCKIENFAYWKVNERSFSNPHPMAADQYPYHRSCRINMIKFSERQCLKYPCRLRNTNMCLCLPKWFQSTKG